MLIEVRPLNLVKYASGSIVGPIWLTVGEWAFPTSAWDDFPVVILGWWAESAITVLTGKTKIFQCYFMDGPYRFTISPKNGGELELKFYNSISRGAECVNMSSCHLISFAAEVSNASRIVLEACQVGGWEGSDIDVLALRATLLAKAIQKYTE